MSRNLDLFLPVLHSTPIMDVSLSYLNSLKLSFFMGLYSKNKAN
jgi:hypothetical protein